MLKLLRGHNTDANTASGEKGHTPLMAASRNEHVDVARLLLDNGADVGLRKATSGVTALYMPSNNRRPPQTCS